MAANAWLAKLNVSPEATCRCGHNAHVHHHGKDCTAITDESRMHYCRCSAFREAAGSVSGSQVNQNQGDEMPKEKKVRVKKPKGEGRTPTLAGLVDGPLTIFMTTGGKEYKGTVLSSGIIKIDEKEFTSPSSAGSYILGNDKKGKPRQVDGWKSWSYNKDGERVLLNTLRGSKSPLKLKAPKPKREKKAKSNGAPKPKRLRKPRAKREQSESQSSTQAEQAVA